MELLSDLINEEWHGLKIMYAEPWNIQWVCPPGERDDYEIHFIEQGSGSFFIGERVYSVGPGDTIILNSLEGNSFRGETGTFRIFYVTFSFSDNYSNTHKIKEFKNSLRQENFPLKMNETENFQKILYSMHRDLTTSSIGHDLRIKLHMGELVMELLDALKQENIARNFKRIISPNSINFVNKVISYIQDNYSSDIRLEKVAKLVNLHPRYLCTLFRQVTGKTLSEFLRQFRIEKAKRLLLYTTLSITEIAYEVGYSNSQYFSKIFNQIEGVEPREFRKTKQNV